MANNSKNRSSAKQPSNRPSNAQPKGPGRGWHGDSEGHARAGSQSHKNK